MPPIQITDPVKDVAKINSAFQQLDALYTRLAAAEKQINYVQTTSTQHQQLAEITGINDLTFSWTGATGTISWAAGSVLNRQGNYVPIPAGSIAGLSASTTYWLAWNSVHAVMAHSTSLAGIQPNKNNLVICNVTTLGAGSNGAIGGGGTEDGGSGFNRTIYATTGGGGGTVTSIGIAVPTGFQLSGSPVTTNGTITIAMPSGWTTGDLLIGNGADSVTRVAIGANTYILTSDGTTASWTAPTSGGTVTSVALSMPAEFSVSGSPITTAGTITVSKANESANLVYAGPSTGAAAAPTFRSLVNADLPTSGVTAGSYTSTNLTVNAQGIITAAANGSGGSGALVLLEQHSAASSASLDFTTAITSTYDTYLIEILYLVAATNGSSLYMRMSTDGGSTWDSTAAHYIYEVWQFQSGFNSIIGSASATQIQLSGGISNTASNGGISASLKLFDPLDTTHYKAVLLLQSSRPIASDGNPYAGQGMGVYKQTAAYNAFQFFMSSGNITSGTIRCYGIVKT